MNLRTFHGKTMAEALSKVKRHFGRDAVILNTRTVQKGKVFGLNGTARVEITAARSMADLPRPLKRGTLAYTSRLTNRAEGAAIPMPPAAGTNNAPPNNDNLVSEVGALRGQINELLRETRRGRMDDLPVHLYDSYRKLVEHEVAEELAQQLVHEVHHELSEQQLHDETAIRRALGRKMEAMLPVAEAIQPRHPGRPTIVALIGPTGVGKTTTIAKLAANLCLRDHRKVGLITIDTYRIAAVEQLRTYANIIDVPLEVVISPEQLKDAVARLADREMILIDTAGRSQKDAVKIDELREFFRMVRPDEVHLVLSSTGDRGVLQETIRAFDAVGVDRVILTKLDEAIGFGVILACLQKANARLSYITTGQDVPDDIHLGREQSLVELILGERTVESCGEAQG